jgi:hypothetical protein
MTLSRGESQSQLDCAFYYLMRTSEMAREMIRR